MCPLSIRLVNGLRKTDVPDNVGIIRKYEYIPSVTSDFRVIAFHLCKLINPTTACKVYVVW